MILGIAGACGGTPLIPRIITQPSAGIQPIGANVSISVLAIGVSLSYQWFKGSTLLQGKTAATLLISNAQESDSGSYSVVVSNPNGSASSSAATLSVVNAIPQITVQPSYSGGQILEGNEVQLSVSATVPSGALTYSWEYYINGWSWGSTGVTTPSISIQLYIDSATKYRCRVTSVISGISVVSDEVDLNQVALQVFANHPDGFSNVCLDLSMSFSFVGEFNNIISYQAQKRVGQTWQDIAANYLVSGANVTVNQMPSESYISAETYRVKVEFDTGEFAFTKGANFINVLIPNSVSITPNPRQGGQVALEQQLPNSLYVAWEYDQGDNSWQYLASGLSIESLSVPNLSQSTRIRAHVSVDQVFVWSTYTAPRSVLPALEASLPASVTKRPLQEFSPALSVGSNYPESSLTFEWYLTGSTVLTGRNITLVPFSAGKTGVYSGVEFQSYGNELCVEGAEIYCVVSDPAGNSVQTNSMTIHVSGSIAPTFAFLDNGASLPRTKYILANANFNLLEATLAYAYNENSPAPREDVWVSENGGEATYSRDAVPLSQGTDGETRVVNIAFYNIYDETNAGEFTLKFGSPEAARQTSWYPAHSYPTAGTEILAGELISLASISSTTATQPITFEWFIKDLSQFGDQWIPIASSNYGHNLPGPNDDPSAGYFVIAQANSFTLRLVASNPWGSGTTDTEFTVL